MNKSLSTCAALALSFVIASAAGAAEPTNTDDSTRGGEPSPRTPLNAASIALLAGHGFKDAFKTGFGGRLGYTLENKIYVGGSFVYHVGISAPLVQANVWYGGGELGYDLFAGPFVVRPYAGIGVASMFASVNLPTVGKTTATDSRFAIWPGAMFLLPFEEGSAFVGVDAKLVVVDNSNAFNTYATFGMAF